MKARHSGITIRPTTKKAICQWPFRQFSIEPAERGGFEPPIESLIPITVFETAAFDHSATSPVEIKIEGRRSRIDDRQLFLIFNHLSSIFVFKAWWSRAGSNRRPPRCERGALPAELLPRQAAICKWQNLFDLPLATCPLLTVFDGVF